MPEMASYVGIEPRTVIPTAVAVARGIRLVRGTDNLVSAAGSTVRGDYISLVAAAASEPFAAVSLQGGGKVPAVASETTTVGALAYSAASGKTSVTSTSAVLLGRWTTATAADALGEVELFNPA